jgi:hypothetical protein
LYKKIKNTFLNQSFISTLGFSSCTERVRFKTVASIPTNDETHTSRRVEMLLQREDEMIL